MHISKIEIENIKSYAATTLEFDRGTTAITGENGAGKTTLIEVIAWTLFDLLEYKKEDFLRRGAKKGWARVTFESGLDERKYEVYRDTGTAYHVTDPRLKTRIADKREEVTRFLWQHLGLEPGTDLKSLFQHAIGVPQGTFTAIFLDSATARKAAFDRLLKVEEYRQAAEKLRDTGKFVDQSIATIREQIARAEGELARSDEVEKEHLSLVEEIAKLSAGLETLKADLDDKKASVTKFDLSEKAFTDAAAAHERLRSDLEKNELILGRMERDLAAAVEAAERIKTVGTQAARHTEVLGLLKELERERVERDRQRQELAKTDTALVKVNADSKRLTDEIEAAQRARVEIVSLEPKAVEQDTLEKKLAESRDRVSEARSVAAQITGIDQRLAELRESFRANKVRIDEAAAHSQAAAELKTLEERDSQLLHDLAGLRASLERDEKFQSEVRNGLCPILSQRCLNLEEGQTLESFITSQFEDLRSRIAAAEGEYGVVTSSLRAARMAQQHAAAAESYRQREEELKLEGQRLNSEKATLEARAAQLSQAERELADLEAKLAALEDPRSKIRFLRGQLERETDLQTEKTQIEKNIERLENDRQITAEQLDKYAELDKTFADLAGERDATAEAHREFLAREAEAKAVDERRAALESTKAEHSGLTAKAAVAEKAALDAAASYNPEDHAVARLSLLESERGFATRTAMLDASNQRASQLATELARFAEIRGSLGTEFREKERLENVAEAITFIRNTLKEAAPRVARNYVYHVSLEANQMFREITGNAERTLKWGEDYAVLLEEEGYERPFQSLSGGEQMAAALSVRLALLKQLTDIRVAFFDEPTTNMDAERRENLALQISRITHFDQLFVISHDDTFEGYVDHVISIGDRI